jgi:hypothetical protein
LQSNGWFYPEDHPLASGKIELKMMTAKEEDILTSQNLIKKGIVLQSLLSSLIVDKRIKQDDILMCDINGVYMAIRRMAYGDQYGPLKIKCPNCGQNAEHTIDLGLISSKEFSFEKYPRGQNLFTFVLPYSKKTITYKILTQKDDDLVETELKAMNKTARDKDRTSEVTTRLKYVIKSIDGETSMDHIRKFVETQLVAKDALALRTYIKENIPALDMSYQFECSNCSHSEKMEVPMTVQFFWPSS